MREVVEVEPGRREHAEVHGRPLVLPDPLLEERAAGLERPGDEGREAAGVVLERPDRVQVVEDVLRPLYVAVHHRGRALEALPVRLPMNVEPGLGPPLFRLDARSHSRRENLGAAAGQGRLAGLSEPGEDLADREARDLGHRADLRRREEMGRDLREAPACLPDEREVVVEGERRIVAALQQYRRRALDRGGLHLREHLVHGERVGLGVTGLAVERAELAVGDADVRVVRVGVDDERHRPLGQPPDARGVGERAELKQRCGGEQIEAVLAVESPAALDPLPDGVERGGHGEAHGRGSSRRRSSVIARSSSGPSRYVKPRR